MKIHSDPQRSEAWYKRRRGIPTASQFDRIITPAGKPSAQARKYMYELAYEQVTNKDYQKPNLAAIPHIQHGITNEDRAVEMFNERAKLSTKTVGFITDDAGSMGCSPDRLIVGKNEAVEIKCPRGDTQCGYLIDGLDAYKAQLQGQIMIGQFDRLHFFSWSDELPSFYQIVMPDFGFIASLHQYLMKFSAELITGVAHIRSLGSWPRNAPSAFPDEPDDAA